MLILNTRFAYKKHKHTKYEMCKIKGGGQVYPQVVFDCQLEQ